MSEPRPREHAGRLVWIGLAIAILLDSAMQLVWKLTVMDFSTEKGIAAAIGALLRNPMFWFLAILLVAQFFNWMVVLARSDVSFAQPITALSYVMVTVLCVICLDERFTAARGLALVLILAGVWLIGTTPAQTQPVHEPHAMAGGRR